MGIILLTFYQYTYYGKKKNKRMYLCARTGELSNCKIYKDVQKQIFSF